MQSLPGIGWSFQIEITGPPGVYSVLGSSDLAVWSDVGTVTNRLGAIVFTDVTAHLSSEKFYGALRQSPPTSMVFIAPNIMDEERERR